MINQACDWRSEPKCSFFVEAAKPSQHTHVVKFFFFFSIVQTEALYSSDKNTNKCIQAQASRSSSYYVRKSVASENRKETRDHLSHTLERNQNAFNDNIENQYSYGTVQYINGVHLQSSPSTCRWTSHLSRQTHNQHFLEQAVALLLSTTTRAKATETATEAAAVLSDSPSFVLFLATHGSLECGA